EDLNQPLSSKADTARGLDAIMRHAQSASPESERSAESAAGTLLQFKTEGAQASASVINEGSSEEKQARTTARSESALPPIASAANLVREVPLESVSTNIRPLGQLEESFIIATDDEGLLLIDQHVAHERVLFDKYRALEASRRPESQQLLIPETFDLTPAQAAAFDSVSAEFESYG